MSASDTFAAAAEYLRRGWRALPAETGAKQCYLKGWPDLDLGIEDVPKYFAHNGNVVVVTGARSRDLVDVDLDCVEAVALADLYLPGTEAIFGRPSKPQSHRLYIAPGMQFAAFGDPLLAGKNMLLEARSKGHDGGAHQTLFPPSVADGEGRQWSGAVIAPRVVSSDRLLRAVVWLAIGCLVARYVGQTPARRPGCDLPKLLAEVAPGLGERAAEWLARADPTPLPPRGRRDRRGFTVDDRELAEIVAAIPNPNLNFWEWNRIGLALFSATRGSSTGLEIFHEFSGKSAKYQPHAVDKRWKNYRKFPPSRIGVGSLVYFARQAGWRRR